MSDKQIRELEEYCLKYPEDDGASERLANMKARAGLGSKIVYTITNPDGKHYYQVKETIKWNREYTRHDRGQKATFASVGKEFASIEHVYAALNSVVEKGVVEQLADCKIVKRIQVEIDVGPVTESLQAAIDANLATKKAALEQKLKNLESDRANQIAALSKAYEDKKKATLKEIEKAKRKLEKTSNEATT